MATLQPQPQPQTPTLAISTSFHAAADALSSYSRAQAFYGSNFAESSEDEDEDEDGLEAAEGGELHGDRDGAEADEDYEDYTEYDEFEGLPPWHRPAARAGAVGAVGAGIAGETIDEDSVFEPSTYTSSTGLGLGRVGSGLGLGLGGAPGSGAGGLGRGELRMTSAEELAPRVGTSAGPAGGSAAAAEGAPTSPSSDEATPTASHPPPSELSPLLVRKKTRAASAALPRGPSGPPTRRRASQPIPRIRSQRLASVSYGALALASRRPSVRARASWGLLKTQAEAPIAEAPGVGTSTFGQSLFNCIAILLGIGVLSESMAFAYAGWIGGFGLLVLYGVLTCYTAKILVRIMALDPRIKSYADISRVAFGPRSIWLTISMFCLELFTLSVILVLLFSDTLHELFPAISSDMWKLLGLVVVLPTCFLPLNLLAFTSILGILSIVLLVGTVITDGLSIRTSPGSLFTPAPTSLLPDWPRLPIAFGLLMSSFSGHTIIPSLAKDMKEPERFDSMITWAYAIATVLYGVIASAGYLMFGNAVSDEVSKDLVNTPGYPKALNIVMAVGLVINPLSKYALCTRPLSTTIESLLGLGDAPAADPHGTPRPSTSGEHKPSPPSRPLISKQTLSILLSRTALTLLVTLTAILVPSFSIVMSFLGAFSAFLLCVIGPVCAKCAVEGRWGWADLAILTGAGAMAVVGTVTGVMDAAT